MRAELLASQRGEVPGGAVLLGEAPQGPPLTGGDLLVFSSAERPAPVRYVPLAQIEHHIGSQELNSTFLEALRPEWVKSLLKPVEGQSPWRFAHSLRVALVADKLGRHLEVDDTGRLIIVRAALLHDVGFIDNERIPKRLVNNYDRSDTTAVDWEGVETHPEVSADRISEHDPEVAQIAVGHHGFQGERSYPALRLDDGSFIYLAQKIVATADIADAMQDPDRPHVDAKTPDETRDRMVINFGEEHSDVIDLAIDQALLWQATFNELKAA